MSSFAEPEQENLYVSALLSVTEVPDGSREGWNARGDYPTARKDILDRFKMWKLNVAP